jgi:hypothetical protein
VFRDISWRAKIIAVNCKPRRVLLAGLLFHTTWVTAAVMTYRSRKARTVSGRVRKDAVLELPRGG